MFEMLSKAFGSIVARRNAAFDGGKKPIVRVTVPVISVGNLSTGGTGKTPVVQMLVRMLQDLGMAPAVVMRGYKRSTRGLLVVHDGSEIKATVREAGDEAFLHAQVLNVPVLVSEYKADAAVFAAGNLPCTVIVIDDGFQHRSLYRDLDVIIVDPTTINEPYLLPRGRLREPLTAMSRAQVVLLHEQVNEADARKYCSQDALVAHVCIHAVCPQLDGLHVLTMCGIANPSRFAETVRACGGVVEATETFADHHWYTKSEVRSVIAHASRMHVAVATTEKDAVKLTHAIPMFVEAGVPLIVVPITAQVPNSANELVDRLKQLC